MYVKFNVGKLNFSLSPQRREDISLSSKLSILNELFTLLEMKSSSVSNSKVAAQVRLTDTASDKKHRRNTKPLVDAVASPQKK